MSASEILQSIGPLPAWLRDALMIWFWLGFFALVALLLVLDLGVLHRKAKEPTLRARRRGRSAGSRSACRSPASSTSSTRTSGSARTSRAADPAARPAATPRSPTSRRTCSSRRSRSTTSSSSSLAVHAVPGAGEVPAPRAVLGNPRRDRLPRSSMLGGGAYLAHALRLDLLHLRRLPRVAGHQARCASAEDDDDDDEHEQRACAVARSAPVRADRRRRSRRQVLRSRSTAGAR